MTTSLAARLNELTELKSLQRELQTTLIQAAVQAVALLAPLYHRPSWLQLLGIMQASPTHRQLSMLYNSAEHTLNDDALSEEDASKVASFLGTLTHIRDQQAKASQLFDQNTRAVLAQCLSLKDADKLTQLSGLVPMDHPYFVLIRDFASESYTY